MPLEIIIRRDTYKIPRLNAAERERAMLVSPKTYPQDMPCCVCGFRWMQHKGTLCPARPGYFDPISGLPVPPTFSDTEFLPDVNFFKEADFDAV